jgi:hypothetical protein
MSLDETPAAVPGPDPLPPHPAAPPAGNGTPPPDPPDPPEEGFDLDDEAEDDPGKQVNHATGVHAGGDVSFHNTAYHIREAQRQTSVRRFSLPDGEAVRETDEQWAVEHFRGVDGEAESLVRHLEERRVLVLSAPAGARKVTAATSLALRLRERSLCTQSAFVFTPLERHVRVDLRRMLEKHKQFQNRVVIFRDPLSRGNPDLMDTLTTTDHAGWVQLAECLRRRNAYLVFTATPAEAAQLQGTHTLEWVHKRLSPHPAEVLNQWLDAFLAPLRERADAAADTVRALDGFRDQLVKEFAFGPQLKDFAEFFGRLGNVSMGFDEAYVLFQDTRKRLLHDLHDDFDGWSFGFTLALAQCTPDANGVSWVDFDRLRRYLRRWLQRDLQLAGTPRDDEDAEPSEVRLEVSDEFLLTRSRACVEKDPDTLADAIRFCDRSPPQVLWRDLLGRHRRVLTAILPRLRDLAERGAQDERSMNVLAAQIIGRIGEMDCERIVMPLAERWAVLGDGRHRGLLGAMFDGVLASDDSRFRERCLQHLKSMHGGRLTGLGKRRVEAATAAYSWVGYHEFETSMDELFAIARTHLVPMIRDAASMSRVVTGLKPRIERDMGGGDGEAVRKVHEVLRLLVDSIYVKRLGIFLGVQYALASLCAAHGVARVLRELRNWIGRGGASMGVLVALMFLRERGIADHLREERTEFRQSDGSPPVSCGQFVRALGNGEEDVRQAVRFLGDLYDCVTSPWSTEALVRHHFSTRLQAHLREWVLEALCIPELVEPARRLVEQLAHTHRGMMRKMVVRMVTTGDFTRKSELKRFAASLNL